MVSESTNEVLVLRRTFAAAPKDVFQVWTTPEYMQRWFRPSKDFVHPFIEVDLRVGGQYRVAFESPEGRVDVVKGEFLKVDHPQKLVYSWSWEQPHEFEEIETQVTVDFFEKDGGTELVLTHERFTKAEMQERHMVGWTGALDLCEELMMQDREV